MNEQVSLRLTIEAIRNMPRLLALRINQWVMDMHQPEWIDGPAETIISGQYVCSRCRVPAPCQPWMDAAERAAELRNTKGRIYE